MANHPLWRDEYWLPLMQLYLKKPEGMKALYSKGLVNLALELHIEPRYLYHKLFELRQIETPRMQQLWERYGKNPRKLSRAVKLLKNMRGFGRAEEFYAGVEVNESWELDFKEIDEWKQLPADLTRGSSPLKPLKLIMILDLYFRLTPNTMVKETPEVVELAKRLKLTPALVTEVMRVFRSCDPYLSQGETVDSPLQKPCKDIWNRYGNEDPEKLSALAAQLKEYF